MFTKEYWKSSLAKMKNTKYLALMGMVIALRIALESVYIPLGENLHFSFTYLIVALEAMIVGPVAGMISSAVADIVGFMMFPSGAFFPGYTLTAMLGSLIYALAFYQRKVTWPRVIVSKVLTSYVVNVLLGALWSAILYSKGYIYYVTKSAVKNTLLLPLQIVVLYVFLHQLQPILEKRKFIETIDK